MKNLTITYTSENEKIIFNNLLELRKHLELNHSGTTFTYENNHNVVCIDNEFDFFDNCIQELICSIKVKINSSLTFNKNYFYFHIRENRENIFFNNDFTLLIEFYIDDIFFDT